MEYDRALCLIPRDAVDFVLATQPKSWQRLSEHYGAAVRERFVKRLASEIEKPAATPASPPCAPCSSSSPATSTSPASTLMHSEPTQISKEPVLRAALQ
jgi:hypothetical protein